MSNSNPLANISKNQKKILISIGILLIIFDIVTGLIGEMMPDDFKSYLENTVGKEYYKFVWLALLISIVTGLIWLTYKKDFEETNAKLDFSDELRTEIIQSLILRYKERHRQKLDDRIELNLELKYTQKGTEDGYVEKFFASEAKSEDDLKEKLAAVLNKHQYLLIIGEPGAGKSTILLELAIELLDNSQVDKALPIPLIFNLASWNETYKSFGEWMIEVLVRGNGFSKDFATKMIRENQILPLLDGLDELGSNETDIRRQNWLRNKCLISLEDYMSEKGVQKFVICSRINEYASINANAPVNVELLVKNLEIQQVIGVLEKAKTATEGEKSYANPTAATNLLSLLVSNEALRNIVCIPFYFNTIVQIVARRTKNYVFPDNEEDIKAFVVKEFIAEKLSSDNKIYKNLAILKWTKWLAQKLNQYGITNFELVTFDLRFVNGYIFKGFYAIFGAICGYIMMNNTNSQMTLTFYFLFFGFSFSYMLIIPIQNIRKRKPQLNDIFISFLLLIFSIFIFELLILGLSKIFNETWHKFDTSDVIPLILMTAFGFINMTYLEYTKYETTEKPYQRYTTDIKVKVVFGFIVFTAYFLFSAIIDNDLSGLVSLFLLYFPHNLAVIPLIISLTSLFAHFVIRTIIYFSGNLPFKFVTFFNLLTTKRILEYEYGTWRFRHKIIQDYLANLDIEQFKQR